MDRVCDVIVLGTGTAAQTVAYACREGGWSVTVIDSRPYRTHLCLALCWE